MDEKRLVWTEVGRKKVFECKVFSVLESYCTPPALQFKNKEAALARQQTFSVLETRDWAMIVPVIETPQGRKFVMVWQWRFGSKCLSLEFPGGVFEPGENPKEAAARELREETGYTSAKITKLGELNPNPAIMSNKIHFFLAEDLITGEQNLDENEYVEVVEVDAEEVFQGIGKAPYVHAFIGTALSLYLRSPHAFADFASYTGDVQNKTGLN